MRRTRAGSSRSATSWLACAVADPGPAQRGPPECGVPGRCRGKSGFQVDASQGGGAADTGGIGGDDNAARRRLGPRGPWRTFVDTALGSGPGTGTEAAMLVTGFDDRQGCGYVLRTGPHATEPAPGTVPVRHNGVVVLA